MQNIICFVTCHRYSEQKNSTDFDIIHGNRHSHEANITMTSPMNTVKTRTIEIDIRRRDDGSSQE